MNVEKYCSTPQYQKWRKELNDWKFIRKNLTKDNVVAILECDAKINELKKLMKLI